jgi:copper transport protein
VILPSVGGRSRRLSRARIASVFVLAVASLAALAAPAWAHAVVVRTSPAAGSSVPGPVTQLSVTFDEPVSAPSDALRVSGPTPHLIGVARRVGKGRTLVLATGRLRDGWYEVSWRVTADDGDVVEGSYQFGVGAVSDSARRTFTSESRPGAVTWSATLTAGLRWVVFTALALGLGGLGGHALVWRLRDTLRKVGAPAPPPTQPVRLGTVCLLGAAAAIGLAAHAADVRPLTGLLSLRPQAVLAGDATAVPVAETMLFLLTGLLSVAVRRRRWMLALTLFAVVIADAVRSHLREQAGTAGVVLATVHLTAAALWVGALPVVIRTASRWRKLGRSHAAWQLVQDYSACALVAYLVVAATGAAAGIVLIGSWTALISTSYGLALLVKLVVFAAVSVLALRARHRLRGCEGTSAALRLTLSEPRALIAVLAAAAVLVSFAPPRLLARADRPAPSLPPGQILHEPSGGAAHRGRELAEGLVASRSRIRQASTDGRTSSSVS